MAAEDKFFAVARALEGATPDQRAKHMPAVRRAFAETMAAFDSRNMSREINRDAKDAVVRAMARLEQK